MVDVISPRTCCIDSARQVSRSKDYYEILCLEKTCSVEEVKKAYWKLSLKVHPDKNKAPGVDEAFKIVSKAFKCLSDEELQRQYEPNRSG
uniref:J domain-containing protein n=1 Tax=Nymphaea colorata TaxID=210225 RepID=A0A5K1DL23_9MAGN